MRKKSAGVLTNQIQAEKKKTKERKRDGFTVIGIGGKPERERLVKNQPGKLGGISLPIEEQGGEDCEKKKSYLEENKHRTDISNAVSTNASGKKGTRKGRE